MSVCQCTMRALASWSRYVWTQPWVWQVVFSLQWRPSITITRSRLCWDFWDKGYNDHFLQTTNLKQITGKKWPRQWHFWRGMKLYFQEASENNGAFSSAEIIKYLIQICKCRGRTGHLRNRKTVNSHMHLPVSDSHTIIRITTSNLISVWMFLLKHILHTDTFMKAQLSLH